MISSLLKTSLTVILLLVALPASGADLLVSAAISLKEAFVQIASEFQRQHPGDRIIFNFGASGELAQQIERGAPADVFASAGALEMARLMDKHLIVAGSIKQFARNSLVVIVPQGRPHLASLLQLTRLKSVTIGNPATVPAGRYAAEALKRAGVYDTLLSQKKLIFAETVRQALAYVEVASVDAGIVYSTDARITNKVALSFVVPANLSEPIIYPVALVRDSKHVELGRQFINAISSGSGQRILQETGFMRAGP